MSAGLCALFLRLPQLPSVGANAACNWAAGRAGGGGLGTALGCREGLVALCPKTPGGGAVERTASLGQGRQGGSLPAWSPSLRGQEGKIKVSSCTQDNSRLRARLPRRQDRLWPSVLALNKKTRISSHRPQLLKCLSKTEHWAWGARAGCRGCQGPLSCGSCGYQKSHKWVA